MVNNDVKEIDVKEMVKNEFKEILKYSNINIIRIVFKNFKRQHTKNRQHTKHTKNFKNELFQSKGKRIISKFSTGHQGKRIVSKPRHQD